MNTTARIFRPTGLNNFYISNDGNYCAYTRKRFNLRRLRFEPYVEVTDDRLNTLFIAPTMDAALARLPHLCGGQCDIGHQE